MIARYPGRCNCGAHFEAGARIVFAQGYTVNGRRVVDLCPTCRPVLTYGASVGVCPDHWRHGGLVATVLLSAAGEVRGLRLDSTAMDSCGKAWAIVRIDGDRAHFSQFGPEWGTYDDALAAWIAGYVLALDTDAYRVSA